VDSRDEVYAVFDAVDTRVVKFGPDVGQLQKSGNRPGAGAQRLSVPAA